MSRPSLLFALLLLSSCLPQGARRAVLDSEPPQGGNYKGVLKISADNGQHTATAFWVVANGRQYLVTARHEIDNLKDHWDLRTATGKQTLLIESKWRHPTLDLGVIVLKTSLKHRDLPRAALAIDNNFNLGTEAWMLGFVGDIELASTGSLPAPILQRCYFSGFTKDGLMVFNGQALPVASGSPIFMRDAQGRNSIVAVVSGSYGDKVIGADSLQYRTNLLFAAPVSGLNDLLDSLNGPKDLTE